MKRFGSSKRNPLHPLYGLSAFFELREQLSVVRDVDYTCVRVRVEVEKSERSLSREPPSLFYRLRERRL